MNWAARMRLGRVRAVRPRRGSRDEPAGAPSTSGDAGAGVRASRVYEGRLRAPVAVRVRDIGEHGALELSRDGPPYRSALVVGVLDGRPIGDVILDVDDSQRIDGDRLDVSLSRFAAQTPDDSCPRHDVDGDPSLTVVVNTCANPGAVLRAVASALACDPAPAEVIVVENRPRGSPVRAALRQRFGESAPVRYVEEHRPGLSSARNAGLRAAIGEIVAFTDDDVVVDIGWVARIVAAFGSEPDAGCVTGLILPADLETEAQIRIEQFAGFSKGYDRRIYRISEPTSALFPFAAGEFGSGANTALRAEVARELGGFDAALGTGTFARGGEDLDMFVRVLLGGYALVYEPAAILSHEHPRGGQDLRRRAYSYGIGLSAMLTKYMLAGHGPALLVRLPEARRFIQDPNSRKNAGKPKDFPGSLERIERLGMLVGPIAFLRSRQLARHRGEAGIAAARRYRPTWVSEIELTRTVADLRVPARADGSRYERARLLVRAAGDPLGFLDVPVVDSTVPRSSIADALERRGLPNLGSLVTPDGDAEAKMQCAEAEPAISVVICTRERPASLRQTLTSVLGVDYANFEVFVVDNAPTSDGTRALLQELDDRRLHYLVEPIPGLSRARNRGVTEARNDIIAFTDDDVIVDARWLQEIARGFGRSDNVACVTGLATASELETASQAYFETRVKWSDQLSPRLFDLRAHRGDARFFPYAAGEIGAGVNFAVLRAALASVGGFDEALGAGTPSAGGEDLDFFARVILRGFSVAFEPGAIVWHRHRSDPEALMRQMAGYGSGLTAYAFKHLLRARTWATILAALRGEPSRGARATPRPMALRTPGLAGMELRGFVAGPAAYLRGWGRARKLRRAANAGIGAESFAAAPTD